MRDSSPEEPCATIDGSVESDPLTPRPSATGSASAGRKADALETLVRVAGEDHGELPSYGSMKEEAKTAIAEIRAAM